MPSNIKQLRKDLEKELLAESGAQTAQKDAANKLIDVMAKATPIITGELNGGWTATINAPASSSSGINKTRMATIQNRAVTTSLSGKTDFFFTNNIDYSIMVNNRHRFVELSVLEVVQFMAAKGVKITVEGR